MRLGEEIENVEQAGVDGLHIDVMDGHFVEDIAFGCGFSRAIRSKTGIYLNVHLMVQNPERFVERCADAGIDLIFVHLETCRDIEQTAALAKKKGCKLGAAINLDTPVALLKDVIEVIDAALVLSVATGIGGQRYNDCTTGKIEEVRRMAKGRNDGLEIYVDGGINAGNIREIMDAGATCAVVGTALFGSEDYKETLRTMRDAVKIQLNRPGKGEML